MNRSMSLSLSRQAGRVRHRFAWGGLGLLLLLLVVLASGPRNTFGPDTPTIRTAPPSDPVQLDAWLRQSESVYADLRPGLAKQITWNGAPGQRTRWVVVYLHGFSSSRLETAPLARQVAQGLQANLFETRLAGHGRTGQALGEATAQDWLADALEAMQIGQRLGDKVLVMGVSTGGTLATWLATRPEGKDAAYVLISPNYGPKEKKAELINAPWGPELALALEGDQRGEVSGDPREALAWTERYATRALFPMMALVKHVRDLDLQRFQAPVLLLYSPRDRTVEPAEIQEQFVRIASPLKSLEAVTYSEATGQHVLAGDIRAPKATGPMVQRVVAWARALPQ